MKSELYLYTHENVLQAIQKWYVAMYNVST